MKRLTLLRHAKSSWKKRDLGDFDRPLNGRGRRDAPAMGERLAALGAKPDLIVTSPAKRARKTARIVAEELKYKKGKIIEIKDIYEATSDILLELVRSFDDGAGHVLMVGHNPGFTDLAHTLLDGGIDSMPTCGALSIELPVDRWGDVERRGGKLLFFEVPRRRPGRED